MFANNRQYFSNSIKMDWYELHDSLTGRGSGSFAGGLLIGTYGTRQAFQIMGLIGVFSGLVYGMLHFFWLHKYDDAYKISTQEDSIGEKIYLSRSDYL